VSFYHSGQRTLQDRHDTRRLADRIDERLVRDTIDDESRAFIERCDMVFVASADAEGRPQCSYKGGDPGFVRVLDERTIAFPNCDGERSRFVPRAACETPAPAWKTRERVRDVLPPGDPASRPEAEIVES
jgi:predicted pyridoxine 5'-phosphate oxidase superfamily flavin-nucleotide-binding protein